MDRDYEFLMELSSLLAEHNVDSDLELGNCAVSVHIPLGDNLVLRIGRTDDDVAEKIGLWSQIYTFRRG